MPTATSTAVHNILTRTAGEHLRRARQAAGYTLAEAASRMADAAVHPATLHGWEAGYRSLLLGRFVVMCDALTVSPAAVLTGVLEEVAPSMLHTPRGKNTTAIRTALRRVEAAATALDKARQQLGTALAADAATAAHHGGAR